MYIGNIHWKHCRLETSFEFGNINCILETYIGYWKHNFVFWKHKNKIGNIILFWKRMCIGSKGLSVEKLVN